MRDIDIRKLAKLFAKYDYFSEEKTKDEYDAYGYLIDLYDCLSQGCKDELLNYYKIEKKKVAN